MDLTPRDIQIVDLVFRMRALQDRHIQVALFSAGAASRLQRRLTLLVANRFLSRLPRSYVNEPAVYLLDRQSVEGNRLLRNKWGAAAFRRRMHRLRDPWPICWK